MKTLTDHTILYDDECPMCNIYTGAFIKTGMMEKNGRAAFSKIVHEEGLVDWERAGNEIALINTKDQTVLYGLDSLFKIIGHNFPWLRPVFRFFVVRSFLKYLYFLISYNRKVIAPGATFEAPGSCKPTLNIPYRILFIAIAFLASARLMAIVLPFSEHVEIGSSTAFALLAFSGLLIAQTIVVLVVSRGRLIHYLGNLATVLLAGSLVSLPWMAITSAAGSAIFSSVSMATLFLAITIEHHRRARILELPWIVTGVWLAWGTTMLSAILA